jgi:class 3 adenylate cyclase
MLPASPLEAIEPRLRLFLPADLYAASWVDPSPTMLEKVFEHLRTLQRILYDYTSRRVSENPGRPGKVRFEWQKGSLMFTDMAGFTRLMEANSGHGNAGAAALLKVLNEYFTEMIEIVSKSGGDLLEFTGDALLVLFPEDQKRNDTLQAVRAGLRMQRAMKRFSAIDTPEGKLTLQMRVGIHTGRFLTASIGTPRRMENILLGSAVQAAKLTESGGTNTRVCLSEAAHARVGELLHFEAGNPGYQLVIDDLTDEQLGEYEVTPRRRMAGGVLFDRSVAGLISEISRVLESIEALACLLPAPVLNLLVESAADRHIAPDFPSPTVVFVNFIGLPETVDRALPGEENKVVNSFSRAFAAINAAVEKRGGVLKKITYHLSGSDIVIYFGVPNAHTNDSVRAVQAALAIREVITALKPPTVGNVMPQISCKIGISRGAAFAAEIGELRGRREFNVLGDTINTAARLMNRAESNQIQLTGAVYENLGGLFRCESLGSASLKGKSAAIPIYALLGPAE